MIVGFWIYRIVIWSLVDLDIHCFESLKPALGSDAYYKKISDRLSLNKS